MPLGNAAQQPSTQPAPSSVPSVAPSQQQQPVQAAPHATSGLHMPPASTLYQQPGHYPQPDTRTQPTMQVPPPTHVPTPPPGAVGETIRLAMDTLNEHPGVAQT